MNALINNYNIPLLTAFLLGVLTSISPCPLATNITAVAYISKEIKTILYPLTPYRLGKKNLYHIYITLKNSPELSAAANPFHLAIIPSR